MPEGLESGVLQDLNVKVLAENLDLDLCNACLDCNLYIDRVFLYKTWILFFKALWVHHYLENSFFVSNHSLVKDSFHDQATSFSTDETSEIHPTKRPFSVGNPLVFPGWLVNYYNVPIRCPDFIHANPQPKSHAKKSLRNGFWIVEHG